MSFSSTALSTSQVSTSSVSASQSSSQSGPSSTFNNSTMSKIQFNILIFFQNYPWITSIAAGLTCSFIAVPMIGFVGAASLEALVIIATRIIILKFLNTATGQNQNILNSSSSQSSPTISNASTYNTNLDSNVSGFGSSSSSSSSSFGNLSSSPYYSQSFSSSSSFISSSSSSSSSSSFATSSSSQIDLISQNALNLSPNAQTPFLLTYSNRITANPTYIHCNSAKEAFDIIQKDSDIAKSQEPLGNISNDWIWRKVLFCKFEAYPKLKSMLSSLPDSDIMRYSEKDLSFYRILKEIQETIIPSLSSSSQNFYSSSSSSSASSFNLTQNENSNMCIHCHAKPKYIVNFSDGSTLVHDYCGQTCARAAGALH